MKTKLFIALTISFIMSPILTGCLSSGSSSGESGSSSPAISFSPVSGPVGTLITVSSTSIDLSTLQSVSVGGVSALVLAQSNSSASILVLPGSTTGKVAVTTSTSTISSADDFDVDTPTTTPVNQQGPKLVGTGGVGGSNQGYAVAVSADGNTVLIGGRADDSNVGAAWVFTRSGTTWSQQGTKLVGTGAVGAAGQGNAVALSADGNTALIAGFQLEENERN